MNRILSLIGVVLVVGCSEPIPRNIDELMSQGETLLDPETLEPYSGPVFGLFSGNPSRIQYRFNLKDGVEVGPYESYHDNGQLSEKGTMKDGEIDGPVENYHENSQLWSKGTMKDGELDGPYEDYYENGQLKSKGTFKDGEKCGEWIEGGGTVTYDPC